jgi:hypothetical protein
LLLYLETRVVDYGGIVDAAHLSTKPGRPFVGETRYLRVVRAEKCSTRLADGSTKPNHDDWDCIEDLIAADLLLWEGTGANPVFVLTDLGHTVAAAVRKARAKSARNVDAQIAAMHEALGSACGRTMPASVPSAAQWLRNLCDAGQRGGLPGRRRWRGGSDGR